MKKLILALLGLAVGPNVCLQGVINTPVILSYLEDSTALSRTIDSDSIFIYNPFTSFTLTSFTAARVIKKSGW
tara:strand:+ start:490 stop:708 length:219 start_codon:yes stop_codon:yes gene_type:complete